MYENNDVISSVSSDHPLVDVELDGTTIRVTPKPSLVITGDYIRQARREICLITVRDLAAGGRGTYRWSVQGEVFVAAPDVTEESDWSSLVELPRTVIPTVYFATFIQSSLQASATTDGQNVGPVALGTTVYWSVRVSDVTELAAITRARIYIDDILDFDSSSLGLVSLHTRVSRSRTTNVGSHRVRILYEYSGGSIVRSITVQWVDVTTESDWSALVEHLLQTHLSLIHI